MLNIFLDFNTKKLNNSAKDQHSQKMIDRFEGIAIMKKKKTRMGIVWNMKIAICDDSQGFLNSFERSIHDYGALKDINLDVHQFNNVQSLLSQDLSNYDVLFLDIDMPGINGIEAARDLRLHYPDLILVFVTGWIEYAPSGYRVNAFRYLLKNRLENELEDCLNEVREKLFENAQMITVNTRDCIVDITLKSVEYLEGTQRRSVLFHLTNNQEPLECPGKLSDYDVILSEKGFLRLQKSFLVNMAHVVRIRNYYATLKDGTELKVSERQYAEVKKRFLLWKGQVI